MLEFLKELLRDSDVWKALISALVGGIGGRELGRRTSSRSGGDTTALQSRVKELEEQLDQFEDASQRLSKTNLRNLEAYGLVVGTYTKITTLRENLPSQFQTTWGGVRVEGGSTFDRIPKACIFKTNGSSILDTPRPALTVAPGFTRGKKVYLSESPTEDGKIFSVVVSPALRSADKNLSFSLSYSASGCHFLLERDIKNLYGDDIFQSEYSAAFVSLPMEKLVVEVRFPDPTKDYQPFPGVFFGTTELIHDPELERVKDSFRATAGQATLEVEHPLPGFSYLVAWDGTS